jgi:hypothetical protein
MFFTCSSTNPILTHYNFKSFTFSPIWLTRDKKNKKNREREREVILSILYMANKHQKKGSAQKTQNIAKIKYKLRGG